MKTQEDVRDNDAGSGRGLGVERRGKVSLIIFVLRSEVWYGTGEVLKPALQTQALRPHQFDQTTGAIDRKSRANAQNDFVQLSRVIPVGLEGRINSETGDCAAAVQEQQGARELPAVIGLFQGKVVRA
jgi:hypothetical protein